MEGCKQFRVAETDEWLATHEKHGEISKRLNEHQPPKGTYVLYTMHCPCGASHIVSEESQQ
jgi:hypothetical protein